MRNEMWPLTNESSQFFSFVGGVMQHHTGADSRCVSTIPVS
jgi:hypothetical protein